MSQMLPAAHSVHAAAHSVAHVVAAKLPEPTAKVTIPIIVVFALIALLAIVRKLIARDAELIRSFALGYGIRAVVSPAAETFVTLADMLQPREAPATIRVAARPAMRALTAAGA